MAVSSASVGGETLSDSLGAGGGGGGGGLTSGDLRGFDAPVTAIAEAGTRPLDMAWNDDGTKFYKMDLDADTVREYDLTVAYDVSTATFNHASPSNLAQDSQMNGLAFKSDGTKMYLAGQTNDSVYQYSLSTAWDVSTASYDSVSVSVLADASNPTGLSFKPDGTRMYVSNTSGGDTVTQYTLTTAWDITTASSATEPTGPSSTLGSHAGHSFNSDGTVLYGMDSTEDIIYVWNLSTGFDVSTATLSPHMFYLTPDVPDPGGILVAPDGSQLLVSDQLADDIIQYTWAQP